MKKIGLTILLVLITSFIYGNTTSLKLKEKVSSTIQAGTENIFELNAEQGDLILLRLERGTFELGEEVNLLITVIDSAGKIVEESNTANDASVVIFSATNTGKYIVKVRRWNGAESGTYNIVFDLKIKQETDRNKQLNKLLNYLYDSSRPGAAISIIEGDKYTYEEYFGKASLEYNTPINASTTFDIASLSKMFTAYGIAMLIDQKIISREDTILTFFPDFPSYGKNITIHHLIHNLSGIKNYEPTLALTGYSDSNFDKVSYDRILRAILNHKDTYFEPGTSYRYSNSGYILLGEIISRSTGIPYTEWIDEHIFKPLQMDDTFILDKNRAIHFNKANSYKKEGGAFDDIKTPITNYSIQPANLRAIGASHVISSLQDMQKWSKNYKTGELGGKEVLKIIDEGIIPEEQNWDWYYGFQRYFYKGTEIRVSQGLTQGYRTYFARLPQLNINLIYLANDGEWRTYYIVNKILDLFLTNDLPKEEISTHYNKENDVYKEPEGNKDSMIKKTPSLESYTGTYYNNQLQTSYKIELIENGLVLTSLFYGPITLNNTGTNSFESNTWFCNKIEFHKNETNDSQSINIFNNRDGDYITFNKIN